MKVSYCPVARGQRERGEVRLGAAGARFGAQGGQPGQDGVPDDLDRAGTADQARDRERGDEGRGRRSLGTRMPGWSQLETRNSKAFLIARPLPFDFRLFEFSFVPVTLRGVFLNCAAKALDQPLLREARRQPCGTLQTSRRPVGRPVRRPPGLAGAGKARLERAKRLGGAFSDRKSTQPRTQVRPRNLSGKATER